MTSVRLRDGRLVRCLAPGDITDAPVVIGGTDPCEIVALARMAREGGKPVLLLGRDEAELAALEEFVSTMLTWKAVSIRHGPGLH